MSSSGVSQACRRVKDKIRKDKKLERKISKIEKKDKGVKNEDLAPMSSQEKEQPFRIGAKRI